MTHLTNLDLSKNQLQNALGHILASAPSSPTESQKYYNSADHREYYWNGTQWVPMDGQGASMTGDNIVTAINGSSSTINADNISFPNELAALQALADTAGFVKKTGNGAYSIDTSTYGTSNLAVADLSGTAETLGGSASVGVATTAARSDHKHAITNPALDTLASPSDITTLNASTTAHGLAPKAVAPSSGLVNVLGIANGETAFSNKPLFDSTNPAGIGSAAPGTALVAARRDHVHAIPNGAVTLAMHANMATANILGRTTAGSGAPEELTAEAVKTLLGIDDVVSASHTQGTDTGTTSSTFTIGSSGPKVKNSSGEVQMRNNGDTDFADLRVKNLVVEGTTTTVNSETIELADNHIVLNRDITTSAANSDGGIAIKRLMTDNSTRKDAELVFNNSTGKWQTTQGAVTATLITAQIANKVSAAIGDGAATSYVITHNLNSRDLNVMIRQTNSPYNAVITDIAFTSLDTITVSFAVAPTSNQYTVTIVG